MLILFSQFVLLVVPQTALALGVLAALYALIALFRPRRLRTFGIDLPPLAPAAFLHEISCGLFCASGAGGGPQVLFKRKLVLRWIYVRARKYATQQNATTVRAPWCSGRVLLCGKLCARRRAASRTRRQGSHTELALPWYPVVPKFCISANLSGWPQLAPNLFFGELVWLGPELTHRTRSHNSHTEFDHRSHT